MDLVALPYTTPKGKLVTVSLKGFANAVKQQIGLEFHRKNVHNFACNERHALKILCLKFSTNDPQYELVQGLMDNNPSGIEILFNNRKVRLDLWWYFPVSDSVIVEDPDTGDLVEM